MHRDPYRVYALYGISGGESSVLVELRRARQMTNARLSTIPDWNSDF